MLLLVGKEAGFGGEDGTCARVHLAFAHSARAFSSAGGGEKYFLGTEGGEQRTARLGRDYAFTVIDADLHVPFGGQFGFGKQKHANQYQRDDQEYGNAGSDNRCIYCCYNHLDSILNY